MYALPSIHCLHHENWELPPPPCSKHWATPKEYALLDDFDKLCIDQNGKRVDLALCDSMHRAIIWRVFHADHFSDRSSLHTFCYRSYSSSSTALG